MKILSKIKALIGRLTLPDTVYICEVGNYWIDFVPSLYSRDYDFSTYCYLKASYNKYNHSYRMIEQNRFGVWKESKTFLHVYKPLKEVV